MRRLLFLTAVSLFLVVGGIPADAARRQPPRPLAGIGLLIVRAAGIEENGAPVPLYRRPGLDRIVELSPSRLTGLDAVIAVPSGERRAIVTSVRGGWCRIIYDDADREAWLEKPRSWQFVPWERYLKGRFVRVLPGLRQGFAVVRQTAADTAPELAPPVRKAQLRVLQVDGDWAEVMVDFSRIGWLRWRDRDGRFLVAVEERAGTQNR